MTQGAFSDKYASDVDGFTNEVIWCSSYKNYFFCLFQMNDKMVTKHNWFK